MAVMSAIEVMGTAQYQLSAGIVMPMVSTTKRPARRRTLKPNVSSRKEILRRIMPPCSAWSASLKA